MVRGDGIVKKVLRTGYSRFFLDEVFKEHLEFIKKNINTTDEITLFA